MKMYYRHAAESATEPQNIEWSDIGKVSNWGEDLAPVERVSVDFCRRASASFACRGSMSGVGDSHQTGQVSS